MKRWIMKERRNHSVIGGSGDKNEGDIDEAASVLLDF